MKKIVFTLCLAVTLTIANAQYWNTSLNASSTLKLGTSSADNLNFYTYNRLMMSLSTHGVLKLDSMAGSGDRMVIVDQDGNMRLIPTGNNTLPGSPCVTSAYPWSQGGNYSNSSTNRAGTCNNYDFVLKANDKESIFLKTNGYVGIGLNNSSPSSPVDMFDGVTSGNTDHLRFYPNTNGAIESTTDMNLIFGTGKDFVVSSGSLGGGTTWRLLINSIQTTMQSDLEVLGFTKATKFQANGTGTADALKVYNTSTNKTNFLVLNSGLTQIGTQTNATNAAMLNVNMNSSNTGSSADNAIDVYDQSSQKINFRVKASGYVYAKELNIQLTTFPDYVFEEGYRLQSLEGLESYIKANKHLPGVPTAAEVEKKGANLGELVKTQMEKIEELTLYVIELKKEIDILKEKVSHK